jgi:RNA polymerase sigma factor for flagellar operon FliA
MLNAVPNRTMSSDTPPKGDRPNAQAEGTGGGSQNPIYQRYLPLVRRITMRLVRKLPPEVTLDDLLGAGWLGLVEALRRRTDVMDEEQFEAYASHRIRGAILDYLRSLDPMSRKLRGASRQISTAIKSLSSSLGRPPEEEEIAGELGLALETYRQLLGDVAQADMARIELTDLVAPSTAPDAGPDHIVTRAQLVQRIAEAIDDLPERLKLVVGLYYQEELNLKEIGLVLEVTESRVCQLHSEAVHRIRAAVEDDAPASSRNRMRLRSVP